MKRTIAKQWVTALRSGQYRQGTGQLRQDDKFCCLGVLCNLHAQAHPGIAAAQKTTGLYMGQLYLLPKEVVKWAGMKSDIGNYTVPNGDYHTLAIDNDHFGKSFNDLASVIEHNWVVL